MDRFAELRLRDYYQGRDVMLPDPHLYYSPCPVTTTARGAKFRMVMLGVGLAIILVALSKLASNAKGDDLADARRAARAEIDASAVWSAESVAKGNGRNILVWAGGTDPRDFTKLLAAIPSADHVQVSTFKGSSNPRLLLKDRNGQWWSVSEANLKSYSVEDNARYIREKWAGTGPAPQPTPCPPDSP